jgi:hypothetical protein
MAALRLPQEMIMAPGEGRTFQQEMYSPRHLSAQQSPGGRIDRDL